MMSTIVSHFVNTRIQSSGRSWNLAVVQAMEVAVIRSQLRHLLLVVVQNHWACVIDHDRGVMSRRGDGSVCHKQCHAYYFGSTPRIRFCCARHLLFHLMMAVPDYAKTTFELSLNEVLSAFFHITRVTDLRTYVYPSRPRPRSVEMRRARRVPFDAKRDICRCGSSSGEQTDFPHGWTWA